MDDSHYPMPRSIAVPNAGRFAAPPPPGSFGARVQKAFAGANVALYRLSGGRIGGHMSKAPVLLLHHVGRKSGQARVTPVLFLPDGERLVVAGSNGGASKHPAWLLNLRAHPETTVEVARRRLRVRAREATEAESTRYWPELTEAYPSFDIYKGRTEREIPLMVLEPLTSRSA
jgi:deazaflavin-dependent oxidoreductase (nitroreductase family)